jgi:tetratricopeptide (TPR) repeat protein
MTQDLATDVAQEEQPPVPESGKSRRRHARPAPQRAVRSDMLPVVPATVMTDLLTFLTFVFIYSTNSQGLTNPLAVLFSSVGRRVVGGQPVLSPLILFMMVFTWFSAAIVGLVAESLRHRRLPSFGWWIRALGLHAAIVWGGWLIYGSIQGARLIPGIAGSDLDSQLGMVAGHFSVFTWLVAGWLLVTGLVFAWSWLRDRRLPAAAQPALSLIAGAIMTVIIFVVISSVNIALVRADIIYKQGQAFDNQRNWLSSIELYRRALSARRTEDHYMLFLGRSLLEQAKTVEQPTGAVTFPENGTLDEVFALTPQSVSQMGRQDLLRAAEVVLLEAQRVNPLNTDHTANLARLYRTWADLSGEDAAMRQEMLDRSIAQYNMAVQLSPNAAHLWNEKGSAHLAREERDLAEEAYRHSLALDDQYEQTYLLLADFLDRGGRTDEAIPLLQEGLPKVAPQRSTQMLSFLGVALARTGQLTAAIDANVSLLALQPNNLTAMRNLALLYRDTGDTAKAIEWVEKAIALATGANNVDEIKSLRPLAAQIYQTLGQGDQVLAQYEQLRQVDPNDVNTLNTLYGLYSANQAWNQAVEVLRTLATLEPDNFQHPLAIAQILQQIGQPTDALTFANQALALAPEDQKAAIHQLIDTINGGS